MFTAGTNMLHKKTTAPGRRLGLHTAQVRMVEKTGKGVFDLVGVRMLGETTYALHRLP